MLLQLLLNKQEHPPFFPFFSGPNMSQGKCHNYLGHWRALLSSNPVSHQLFTNTSFLTQKPAGMKLRLQLSINTRGMLVSNCQSVLAPPSRLSLGICFPVFSCRTSQMSHHWSVTNTLRHIRAVCCKRSQHVRWTNGFWVRCVVRLWLISNSMRLFSVFGSKRRCSAEDLP